jgi:hypothetical protein
MLARLVAMAGLVGLVEGAVLAPTNLGLANASAGRSAPPSSSFRSSAEGIIAEFYDSLNKCTQKSGEASFASGACCYDCYGFWGMKLSIKSGNSVVRQLFGEFDFNCTEAVTSTDEFETGKCYPGFNPQGVDVEFSIGSIPSPSPHHHPAPAPHKKPAPSPAPAPHSNVSIGMRFFVDHPCAHSSTNESVWSGECCYDCFGFYGLRLTATSKTAVLRETFGVGDYKCTGQPESKNSYDTGVCYQGFVSSGDDVELSITEVHDY